MVFSLLLVTGAGTARAGDIEHWHFFDFDYATSIWVASPTLEEFDVLYSCPDLEEGAFKGWMKRYRLRPQKALKELDTSPDGDAIKRCYDTRLTYDVWYEAYQSWRVGLTIYGSGGWNSGKPCKGIVTLANIFTGECDDLPNWRTAEEIARNDKHMATGNARRNNAQKWGLE